MAQRINLVVLPTANPEYDFQNELTMRRSIERSFATTQDDFEKIENKVGKVESLALKRYQFLLMGAKGNG
jgi:hypothetical protein|tara:strand:- start:1333 stop:1542 length:210 start_codon:yes stop_codon:yes gene_type:complete